MKRLTDDACTTEKTGSKTDCLLTPLLKGRTLIHRNFTRVELQIWVSKSVSFKMHSQNVFIRSGALLWTKKENILVLVILHIITEDDIENNHHNNNNDNNDNNNNNNNNNYNNL